MLNLCACTEMAFFNSPLPKILIGNVTRLTRPASTIACGVMVPEAGRSARRSILTIAYSFRKGLVKPYFGNATNERHLPAFEPRLLAAT